MVAEGGHDDRDIRQVVQAEVPPESGHGAKRRLDGEDLARRAALTRHAQGVVADVGPDVDRRHARAEALGNRSLGPGLEGAREEERGVDDLAGDTSSHRMPLMNRICGLGICAVINPNRRARWAPRAGWRGDPR